MASSISKCPILVVEDHGDSREALCSLLRHDGFLVLEAANGQEALDLLVDDSVEEPCVIVLDLEMPVMSGWELLAVKKRYHRLAKIPVIVTSVSQRKPEPISSAVVAHLPKPVDLRVFLREVRAHAKHHEKS